MTSDYVLKNRSGHQDYMGVMPGSVCLNWAVDEAPTDIQTGAINDGIFITTLPAKLLPLASPLLDAGTGDLCVFPTDESSLSLGDAGTSHPRSIPPLVQVKCRIVK